MTRDELDELAEQLSRDGDFPLDPVLAGPENEAMQQALVAVAAVMALGLALSLLLPGRRLRSALDQEA